MSVCHGCGGIIGRDCYNPVECEQIARDMQMQQDAQQVEDAPTEQEWATLRGLRDGSLVAVPHDPTEAMLDAAQDEQVGCCTPTQREARIIYQVMLAAVQKAPPP